MLLNFIPSRGAGILGAAALLIAGCSPKTETPAASAAGESVALAKAGQRSKYFEAVNQHLVLGGELYGYVDIEGDLDHYLTNFLTLLTQEMPAETPVAVMKGREAEIVKATGINDIVAAGFSSVAEDSGFINTIYLHAPNGRHGFLKALGGDASAPKTMKLAPLNTDVYLESDKDLGALLDTARELAGLIGGEEFTAKLDQVMNTPVSGDGTTVGALVASLKGRSTIIFRIKDDAGFDIPGEVPLHLPNFDLLIRIENPATKIMPIVKSFPLFQPVEQSGRTLYALAMPVPVVPMAPVLTADGEALVIATSPEFALECLNGTHGLDSDPIVKSGLKELYPVGNAVSYVSPKVLAYAKQYLTDLKTPEPQIKTFLMRIAAQIPEVKRPLMSVRVNLPEGILIRSWAPSSLKQELAMISVYNPVTVGLMAAMAIPAFQKVRVASQEKAIMNNLRQLEAAGQQYMLEEGKDVATYADMVGPDKYIRQITPVAGESYQNVVVRAAGGELSVTTASGRTVTYSY